MVFKSFFKGQHVVEELLQSDVRHLVSWNLLKAMSDTPCAVIWSQCAKREKGKTDPKKIREVSVAANWRICEKTPFVAGKFNEHLLSQIEKGKKSEFLVNM
jgi:hypothetical protein